MQNFYSVGRTGYMRRGHIVVVFQSIDIKVLLISLFEKSLNLMQIIISNRLAKLNCKVVDLFANWLQQVFLLTEGCHNSFEGIEDMD